MKTSRPRQEAETDNFAKANPVDVAELRARINEVVPTKDGSVGNKPPGVQKVTQYGGFLKSKSLIRPF